MRRSIFVSLFFIFLLFAPVTAQIVIDQPNPTDTQTDLEIKSLLAKVTILEAKIGELPTQSDINHAMQFATQESKNFMEEKYVYGMGILLIGNLLVNVGFVAWILIQKGRGKW